MTHTVADLADGGQQLIGVYNDDEKSGVKEPYCHHVQIRAMGSGAVTVETRLENMTGFETEEVTITNQTKVLDLIRVSQIRLTCNGGSAQVATSWFSGGDVI